MDPNRKRRARRMATELGTGAPDPALTKLTDAELERAYEAATRDAEAARQAEAIADPRVRELVRALRGMSDEELLACYHRELRGHDRGRVAVRVHVVRDAPAVRASRGGRSGAGHEVRA